MRVVLSACAGVVLMFLYANVVCLSLVCSLLRCVVLCFVRTVCSFCMPVVDAMGDHMVEEYVQNIFPYVCPT